MSHLKVYRDQTGNVKSYSLDLKIIKLIDYLKGEGLRETKLVTFWPHLKMWNLILPGENNRTFCYTLCWVVNLHHPRCFHKFSEANGLNFSSPVNISSWLSSQRFGSAMAAVGRWRNLTTGSFVDYLSDYLTDMEGACVCVCVWSQVNSHTPFRPKWTECWFWAGAGSNPLLFPPEPPFSHII